MSVIITCQSLTKSFSARPLFKEISFAVDEDDRVGLIGPNGAGKSTLLKILAGLAEPDDGAVVARRNLNTAYLAQDNVYAPGLTLRQVVGESLAKVQLDEAERKTRIEVQLTRMGFADPDAQASLLSGGWRKRLALAAELVKEPEFLLLDEPTNHLDLEGVLWLEELLGDAPFAYMIVSHDRSFLENLTNRTIELNPTYRDGFLSVPGPYSSFLQAHQEAMAAQAHEQQALESQVRREIAWLQRGARARQTKSSHRIREAGKLIEELEQARSRATKQTADIDFSASGRKTKELLVLKGVSKSMGGKKLFGGLDLTLCPGHKLGVLGANGSGKTTLLRILAGRLEPDAGTLKRAPDLKVVWFDQNREQLDKNISLKEALCAEGDSVVYQGRSLHVASWSRRFLFRPDQLSMPVSYLSGGEQARILIARLMLQPADILVLDEPTNDLDIATLTVLEESLLEFPGLIVLVTHDRLLLDTVSTNLLALDGEGKAEFFADYAQFEQHREKNLAAKSPSKAEKAQDSKTENRSTSARTLSTGEKKELAQMEAKISKAEEKVSAIKLSMENPEVVRDHVRLGELMSELQQAESQVAALYERWEDLENRQAALT